MLIGCHLSAADGFRGLARDAIAVGANVFQFFTRNPRGGAAKPIDPADVADKSVDLLWNEKYKDKILMFDNPRDA